MMDVCDSHPHALILFLHRVAIVFNDRLQVQIFSGKDSLAAPSNSGTYRLDGHSWPSPIR